MLSVLVFFLSKPTFVLLDSPTSQRLWSWENRSEKSEASAVHFSRLSENGSIGAAGSLPQPRGRSLPGSMAWQHALCKPALCCDLYGRISIGQTN